MPEVGLTAPQQMIRLLVGFIPARAIYTAAKIGLADQIDGAGSTAEQLALRFGVDAPALERVLRTLTGLGVLHEENSGRFTLTEIGKTLRTDSPVSIRDYALFVHEFLYELFGGLVGSVRSGKPAVEAVFGAPLYTYLQENPDKAALFHSGLSNRGRIEARAILDAYSFANCHLIVDLGGGNGGFLSAILSEHPNLSGMLVERASAIEAARAGRGGPLPREPAYDCKSVFLLSRTFRFWKLYLRRYCYWHLADIRWTPANVPLSGAKRTCPFALQMCASDPKRTSRAANSAEVLPWRER